MAHHRRASSTWILALLLAGCWGKAPAVPPRAAISATAQPAAARTVVVLEGLLRAPAQLLSNNGAGVVSNNGAGVISDHGAGLTGKAKRSLLAVEPWVGGTDVEVGLVDLAGRTPAGFQAVKTDAAGRYRLTANPGTWIVQARFGAVTLATLARLTGPSAEADLDPATTAVAAHLQRELDPTALAGIAAAGFQEVVAATRAVLQQGDVPLDLGSTAAAAAVFEQASRRDAAIATRAAALEQEARQAAATAPTPSATPLEPAPSVAPSPAGGSPAPTATPGALPPSATPTPLNAIVSTVAGTGVAGTTGDGGPAIAAQVDEPYGIALAPDGGLYFTQRSAFVVRRLAPDGTIATVAGQAGVAGYPATAVTVATAAQLRELRGIAVDATGIVYFNDLGNQVMWRLLKNGNLVKWSGFQGQRSSGGSSQAAGSATLGDPDALAFDAAGNLFVSERFSNLVRKIDLVPKIFNFAGMPGPIVQGDGGPATAASLAAPAALAVDAAGQVYIAEASGHRVRRVALDGTITTVAGTGTAGSTGDGGPATAAQLNAPSALAVDPRGNLLIFENGGNRLRVVTPAGTITTAMGTGQPGDGEGDGGPPEAARISGVNGMAFDTAGNLLLTQATHRIRKVAPWPAF